MTKSRTNYSKLYLNEKEISYHLRRSKRAKYLRLQINPQTGLEVVLPYRCKIEDAERFIYKKRDWIFEHLQNRPEKSFYYFLGDKIEIEQSFDLFITKHKISFNKNVLRILSPSGSTDKTDKIYNAWLKHHGKKYLTERALLLSGRYDFRINRIKIRNQKTRWGSCSSKGNISLNYRLMKYRKEIIDYVIIHELCHLKEMNHSKKFWKLVEQFVPDYKDLKKELKLNPD